MYALILNVVVVFSLMTCSANSKRWNSKRRSVNLKALMRPSVNLKTIPCDRVQQCGLCRCCPISPCDGVLCLNEGTCVGDGVCKCASGYSGPNCNISPCDGVVCLNEGKCVGDGVCECASGFTGPNCNINLCDGVVCLNEGKCVGDGVCKCAPGYGGPKCSMSNCNVDECSAKQGECTLYRCTTDGCGDCGPDKVCLNDICVTKGENCGIINGINNACLSKGEQCGDGFCMIGLGLRNKCVNNACRAVNGCDGQSDGTECMIFGYDGSCLNGLCRETCSVDDDCEGVPCSDGLCAVPKCGSSFCSLI